MGFTVTFIQLLFNALFFAILGRVLMSWVDPTGSMRISQILHELTEPVLGPIRNILPPIGMFDFSPIVAMLLLQLIERALLTALLT